jgi:hypothetical protein
VLRLSFVPLYVLAALVLVVAFSAIFVRLRKGRYAEILIARIARIRRVRGLAIRSYVRALERTNPVGARALAKIERVSGTRFPPRAAAPSVLTPEERRAYGELFDDQATRPLNRAQRRRAARSEQKASRARS